MLVVASHACRATASNLERSWLLIARLAINALCAALGFFGDKGGLGFGTAFVEWQRSIGLPQIFSEHFDGTPTISERPAYPIECTDFADNLWLGNGKLD